ncbi:MAG: hypothetical protein M3141_00300 [Actinomycetota bacterium]|nr:hypothetical protein [Actinomycetota bacterium]
MDDAAAEQVRVRAEDAIARVGAVRASLEELLAAVERLRGVLVEPPRPAARRPDVGLESARLVAIEMAVAGRSREEVERHLRASYGGADTSAVLADVFGEL